MDSQIPRRGSDGNDRVKSYHATAATVSNILEGVDGGDGAVGTGGEAMIRAVNATERLTSLVETLAEQIQRL